jgi:hypothetical protein
MRRFLFAFSAVYAAICVLMIFGLPRNKYEWMLDDPAARADGVTFCTLPLDEAEGSAALFSFIFLAPFLMTAIVLSLQRRKIHPTLWAGLGLLAIWALRFFVLSPACPGREAF